MSREGTKGKHLTLEERINILNDLIKGEKLSDIATKIGKDPTTVSKEIKKHRYCNKRKFNLSQRSYCFFCSKQKDCSVRSLCKGQNCNLLCRNCKFKDPTKICKDFISKTCSMTNRFPYTCHTCEKKGTCFLDRYFYDPNIAEKDYKELLVSSRTGINIEQSEFEKIDSIISDGVSKGKSIYSILLNHPEILKSERTIYRYVGNRYLSIKDIDLRNKVKMKPRKQYNYDNHKVLKKEIVGPRNYEAYLKYLAENRTSYIPQLDLVQGKQGSDEPYIMTLIFPFSNLMLGYIIPSKAQEEVIKVFDTLEEKLGTNNFKKLFPAILTDRGNEFLDADRIEHSKNGEQRTKIFYCDPYSSCQKAEIERNHQFIRFYYPKSKSFKDLTQEELELMLSHINSYNHKNKEDKSPYEIFEFIYGKESLDKLNIKKIEYDEIDLTEKLLRDFRKKKKN